MDKNATKSLKRKVHVDGRIWTYKIGQTGVQIVDPDCSRKIFISFQDLLDVDSDFVERAQWKEYFRVGPGDVKHYIIENCLT